MKRLTLIVALLLALAACSAPRSIVTKCVPVQDSGFYRMTIKRGHTKFTIMSDTCLQEGTEFDEL